MPIDLTSLVASIKIALEHQSYFSFTPEKEKVIVESKAMKAQEAFENIGRLAAFTNDILSRKNLRQISYEERATVRDLVDCVYRCSKLFTKQFGRQHPQYAEVLQTAALCSKLGGKISPTLVAKEYNKEFIDFIQANALQHKIQALGHQLTLIPSLPIEGYDEPINWWQLTKQSLHQTSSKDPAFAFTYQGKEVFTTDSKLKLHPDYCYIDGKIAKYNPMHTPELRAYDHEPSNGKYKIELWTALHDIKGQRPVITIGDHAYIVLVDADGRRYGFGQYGMTDEFSLSDTLSPLGRKKGGVETPDRYLLLAKDSHSFMKTEFIVRKEDFQILIEEVQSQKKDPNLSVSLLCGNCSTSVSSLLAKIGIKINKKMHVVEMLWRRCAPLSLIKAFDAVLEPTPKLVKKALYFFPPIYLLTIVYGLIAKALSLKNFNNEPQDISLVDIFLRPWKAKVHHPFVIRRWQQQQKSNI